MFKKVVYGIFYVGVSGGSISGFFSGNSTSVVLFMDSVSVGVVGVAAKEDGFFFIVVVKKEYVKDKFYFFIFFK